MNRWIAVAAVSLWVPVGCKAPGSAPAEAMPALPDGKPAKGNPIMTVAEVEELIREARGAGRTLRSIGRTVFKGTRIENFEAEILDVMHNWIGPKRHLILARLIPESHPVIRKAGVAGGMSGSPMYINGRLIGALAYGWFWARHESLIGITPIEYMIEDARRGKKRSGPATVVGSPEPGLAQIRTPLTVSGLSRKGLEKLQQVLEPYSITVVPAGSGPGTYARPGPFQPGSAIGASLATGDVSLTAIGTVTYVDGDLVIGFGHPFFGDGPTDMPISTAVVHAIFPSISRSFKIASAVEVVGALTQDRSACIAGSMNKRSEMIPVTVELVEPEEDFHKIVKADIVNHPFWFSLILDYVSRFSSGTYTAASNVPRTTVSDYRIRLSTGKTLRFREIVVLNPEGPFGNVSAGLGAISSLIKILRNPWEKTRIEKVEVRHVSFHEMRSAEIARAWPVRPEVEAGGTVRIRVELRLWRKERETVDLDVPLPPEARPGDEITIEIAGAVSLSRFRPPYSNLEELIKVLDMPDYPPTHLIASVYLDKLSLHHRGKSLKRLPGSVLVQMIPALTEKGIVSTTPVRRTKDVGRVVSGTTRITVHVR